MIWVDCGTGRLHWFRAGAHEVGPAWPGGALTSASALADGRLLLTAGRGMFGFDRRSGRRSALIALIPDVPAGVVFNDAKAGPDDRWWAGTVCRGTAGGGALWSFRPDEGLVRRRPGITHGNGLGWNGEATSMWFVDSGERTLSRSSWDAASGVVAEPDLVLSFRDELGIPDGLAVDADDHVWLAMWGGHGVLRIDPQGRIVGRIPLDEPLVTSCAFIGPGLDALMITTARDDADQDAPGGDVHVLDVGVAGAPVPRLSWSAALDWTEPDDPQDRPTGRIT